MADEILEIGYIKAKLTPERFIIVHKKMVNGDIRTVVFNEEEAKELASWILNILS